MTIYLKISIFVHWIYFLFRQLLTIRLNCISITKWKKSLLTGVISINLGNHIVRTNNKLNCFWLTSLEIYVHVPHKAWHIFVAARKISISQERSPRPSGSTDIIAFVSSSIRATDVNPDRTPAPYVCPRRNKTYFGFDRASLFHQRGRSRKNFIIFPRPPKVPCRARTQNPKSIAPATRDVSNAWRIIVLRRPVMHPFKSTIVRDISNVWCLYQYR